MSKLYFRYGAMNCGKSTSLLQIAHNYEERGMHVCIIKPGTDTKGDGSIVSRLGATREVDFILEPHDYVVSKLEDYSKRQAIACVLVDEAQFLTQKQVDELFWFAVTTSTPVICYGLRTDFRGVGFLGASRLLECAHSIEELKTICRCGKKAILNARKTNGVYVVEGDQVAIDGENDVEYESLCAKCYKTLVLDQ